jgi:prepilin-type N-terminal cleavage/methylation domain-containing protein
MRKEAGFSLIELMVVVGILGILTAIAVPATVRYRPSYYLSQASREIMSDLQKARITAIRQNVQVVASFTSGTYSDKGGVGTYIVYLDTNGDWGPTDAGGSPETVVIQTKTMPGTVSMTQLTNQTGTPVANLLLGFNNHGLAARSAAGAFVFGDVVLRNSISQYKRVQLSPSGHVRVQKSADGIVWTS